MKRFSSICIPTDFTEGSHRAFEHGLRLAVDGSTAIRLLHVGTQDRPPWTNFPGIRFTLEKWNVLPPGSAKDDVLALGVDPGKYFVRTDNPVKSILSDLRKQKPELVVMATHARSGLSRLLHPSLCKKVVRGAGLPTLIVPHGCAGFVDSESGECTLKRILIPVSPEVSPDRAVQLATRISNTLQTVGLEATILYVGNQSEMPVFDLASDEKLAWRAKCRQGDVLEELSAEVEGFQPDLIVMMGRGRDSVVDFFLPGKIEQLASASSCPLLIQNTSPD